MTVSSFLLLGLQLRECVSGQVMMSVHCLFSSAGESPVDFSQSRAAIESK